MATVKVLLMRAGFEPTSAEFQFDPRDLPKDVTGTTVSLSVGEPSANAIVTMPLDILTLLMGRVMAKTGQQKPGVLVPQNSLVGPNGEKLS